MKIDVTADTSNLSKGMRESKAAIRDFESVTSNSLDKIGEAFGINVGQLKKFSSAAKGLSEKLASIGGAGASSFGKIAAAAGSAASSIAAIGVGGLIASFKALNAEADNFKSTVRGAMIDMQTAAYLDTYKQVMHDMNSKTGEKAANWSAEFEKKWKTAFATVGAAFSNFVGTYLEKPGKSGGDAFTRMATGITAAMGAAPVAKKKAATASELTGEYYKLLREISNQSVKWQQTEAQIARYKLIAYDKTKDLAEQENAINAAASLITARYQEELAIRTRIADIVEQINALSSSTPEAEDKANVLRQQAAGLLISQDNALREIGERAASIRLEVEKEAEARKKVTEETERMAALREHRDNIFSQIGEVATLAPATLETPEAGALVVPVDADLTPATASFNNFADLAVDCMENAAVAFGELAANLATGGDAWENFGQSALKNLGSMAIQVGKLAIGTGVAALGIKAALKLSPWAAIGAGAALMALGAAVSAGMNNIAASSSGSGYVATAGVAQGGYRPSERNGGTARQSMKVEVTGTLKARGSSLVAVLNNEKERTNHTT